MHPADRDPALDRRQATYVAGRWAEGLAAACLILKGYRILARRHNVRGGEIDIVARRGATIAFVEVKARPTAEGALLAVTETKRRRIERAAAAWLVRNPWATTHVLRGDAILVAPGRWPRHVVDAFPLRIG